MRSYRVVLFCLVSATLLPAQDVRPKDVREMAKAGSSAIPQLQELLKNPDAGVRIEAVRQITEIGTAGSLDALILATPR
jgi:HEAT repeat protein